MPSNFLREAKIQTPVKSLSKWWLLKTAGGAREMAQTLRVLAALTEDLSLIPSIHMAAINLGSFSCQPETPRWREPQLRNLLYLTGLWPCL